MLRRLVTCICLLGTTIPGHASAQMHEPVTAIVNALALQPMPEARTIEIVTYDDSDLSRSIETVVRNALGAQGYEPVSGGRLVLGIELLDRLTPGGRQGPSLGSVEVDSVDSEEANVRVNIFALNEDSVLGGRIAPGAPEAVVFGLYVTLNDRATGRRIWQAEIMADISGSSRESAGLAMAQAIVTRLGEPIAQEPLVLQ